MTDVEIEQARRRHDRDIQRAVERLEADVLLVEIPHDAAARVETKGAAAGETDGIDLLHEIDGLENATSENLARWIWERLEGRLPGLHRITIRETCTSRCDYYGE